jgi:hypothetical protein
MLIVPQGIKYETQADEECELVMSELEKTLNTGDVEVDMAVKEPEWI